MILIVIEKGTTQDTLLQYVSFQMSIGSYENGYRALMFESMNSGRVPYHSSITIVKWALANNQTDRANHLLNYISNYYSYDDYPEMGIFIALFEHAKNIRERGKEIWCAIMSALVPGSCFLLTDRKEKFLSAIAVNALTFLITVNTLNYYGVLPALVVFSSLSYRYYLGSILKSIEAYKKQKQKKQYQIYLKILRALNM